jgi:hypothetical protein
MTVFFSFQTFVHREVCRGRGCQTTYPWQIFAKLVSSNVIQWTSLNGIAVNGIIRLMGSKCSRLNMSQMSLNNILCIRNLFGYWYHSVNGINFGLAQSDPIKQRPLQILTGDQL